MNPVSIQEQDFTAEFLPGKYYIDILGRWYVNENCFAIAITNLASGAKVRIEYTRWPVQSFEHGKRAKRCYEIEITERGKYSVKFFNTQNLEVKRSNLPIFSMLFKSRPASEISIYIHKKY